VSDIGLAPEGVAKNAVAPRSSAGRGDEPRRSAGRQRGKLVGLGRLELPTSPLSGVRSSHLSYRPNGIAEEKTYSHFMLHGLSCDFN
jgi:hypothetical protein